MINLFVSPHNDDESLFGAFTLCRWADEEACARGKSHPVVSPRLLVCFDSFIQVTRGFERATAARRREETLLAVEHLGLKRDQVDFLGLSDLSPTQEGVNKALSWYMQSAPLIDQVMFPKFERAGHPHHNLVSQGVHALNLKTTKQVQFLTYTTLGRSTSPVTVTPKPQWVAKKLKALACYTSQHEIVNCVSHFIGDQTEYISL